MASPGTARSRKKEDDGAAGHAEEAASPRRAPPEGERQQAEGEAQSSLSRMLGLLDLFTLTTPVRPVGDLAQYLGTSRSTAYRYIKALHEAGLIEAVANGHYMLGPRIVELDRQIRFSDPLYRAGAAVLPQLVEKTGYSALLCALYSDSVMCIREELAPQSPPSLFSRGQRRPLFAGAASKIVLPYLPPHRLRSIFSRQRRTIAIAGLGGDWAAFRARLAAIRRDGFIVTHSEFNPGIFGISAPVFNIDRLVVGSLGIAGSEEHFPQRKLAGYCEDVVAAAAAVSRTISARGAGITRPPRAVG